MADAKKYAEEKGYELSPENIIEEIVSSFRGKNISEEGHLGAFVKKAENGKLNGSILILEDLDRFSRTDPTVAMEKFLKLINDGVTIATLGERPKEYCKSELNTQMGDLFMTLNEFFRSNGESRRRRGWANEKWRKRREAAANGKVFKMKHPKWLMFIPDEKDDKFGKYEPIPERVAIIERIYQLFNEGQSIYRITKTLNGLTSEGVKSLGGKSWTGSLVKYYLKARSVMGEYQPRKIISGKRIDEGEANPDFFPKIISRDVFDRAQARWHVVPTRNGRPPKDESDEILSGLIRCPYCGGSFGIQEGHLKQRLSCNRAYENACVRVGVKRHFIEWCAAASTDEIFNSMALGDGNTQKLQELEGRLSEISRKKEKLIDLVMAGVAEAKKKVMQLEGESRLISEQLEQERNIELTNEAEGDEFVSAFVTNNMDKEILMKAMFHIRRFVAKVEPYFLGERETYDAYRSELAEKEANGIPRGKLWLKLRKKYQVEKKQFVRITFTRPIDRRTDRVFTYQQYLTQMKLSEVSV
jgi:hypothetical protein